MPIKRKSGDWTIYQYACDVNFKGHSKEYGAGANSIDLDVFNGTVADMRAWLKMDVTPPPPPVDIKAAKIQIVDWMIAQLAAKKDDLSGGGPVGD